MMLLKKSLILLFLLTMSIILSIDIINSSSNILVESANAQSALDSLVAGREEEEEETFIAQNTSMSAPAPVRHPGQPPHEVVFALPLRDDGKIWSGRVTFTASKPIEAEILHIYNPQQPIGEKHGEPYHAVLPSNRSVAISHLRDLVDVPIEITGTGISSGSFEFEGSALVFHKTSAEPFTVTYTINAVVREINK